MAPMTREQLRCALKAGLAELRKEIIKELDAKLEARAASWRSNSSPPPQERRMEDLGDGDQPWYIVKSGKVSLDPSSPKPRTYKLEEPRAFRDPVTGSIRRG